MRKNKRNSKKVLANLQVALLVIAVFGGFVLLAIDDLFFNAVYSTIIIVVIIVLIIIAIIMQHFINEV